MAIIPGNLLSDNDSSFETSAGNWQAQNANTTIVRDTTQAFQGTASLKSTSGAATGLIGPWLVSPNQIPVTAGKNYFHYWWMFSTTAGIVARADIDWYNGATYVSSATPANFTTVANQWVRVWVPAPAPATATLATLIMNWTTTAIGQIVFYDSVFFGLDLRPGLLVQNEAVSRSYTW